MVAVFDLVLDRLEAGFFALHAVADVLLAKTVPTEEDVSRVTQGLPNNPTFRSYFFERLSHPGWLAPLAEAGLFAHPPQATPAPEPGYVHLPTWPEGQFLARMAPHPEVEAIVAHVLDDLPSTDNGNALDAVADARVGHAWAS